VRRRCLPGVFLLVGRPRRPREQWRASPARPPPLKVPGSTCSHSALLGCLARSDFKSLGTENQMVLAPRSGLVNHVVVGFSGGKDRRQYLSQRRGQQRQQTNNASDGAEPAGLSDSIHHVKSLRDPGPGEPRPCSPLLVTSSLWRVQREPKLRWGSARNPALGVTPVARPGLRKS
jgi:hypothetical protein